MHRHEHKSKTSPDGTSEDYQLIEKSDNGLLTLFFVPIGLTLTAVMCWLILQLGAKLGTAINPPLPSGTSSYLINEK